MRKTILMLRCGLKLGLKYEKLWSEIRHLAAGDVLMFTGDNAIRTLCCISVI